MISKRPPVSLPAFRRAANPFEMGETLAGEQLGHFKLEQFIGGGGMGAVFRGTDLTLGRTVAVKVVSREQTGEDALRRFRNEAQSAARLDHPNIARVYFVGEDQGWNYIVFEYIEGVNIRDLVDHDGPLALEDAISYTLQIAEALEHASQRDVIHRDIKPSNILIMVDGRAKLVDMGLARLHQVESSSEDLTASGVTLGTFDYISPEQARDPRNTDVRSDLYSLGCTLFFMLTGQPPFPDGTVLQKLLSHSSEEPPDLLDARPDLDPAVAAIVTRMLAKAPEQRYQTPRELIADLMLLADRLGLSGIRPSGTLWLATNVAAPPAWMRHLTWAVPFTLLLLIVLAQLAWDRFSAIPAPPPPRLAAELGTAQQSPDPSGTQVTRPLPGQLPTVGERKPSAPPLRDGKAGPALQPEPDRGAASVPVPKSGTLPDTRPSGVSGNGSGTSSAATPGAADTNGSSSSTSPPRPSFTDSSDNGSPGSTPATPGRTSDDPRVMVVSNLVDRRSPGAAATTSSLEEALRRAGEIPEVNTIELRFDGVQWIQPTAIDVSRVAGGKLTIRAAEGFTPVVAFMVDATPFSLDIHQAMLHVTGGQLAWFDTHFYLEIPPDADSDRTWSLFQLQSMDGLEFHHCTMTIRNVDAAQAPSARRVSFFEIMPGEDFGDLFWDAEPLDGGSTPTIRLQHSIARGQATLVRSDHAIPFWVVWEHGLFVSTQRLIEVGGTMTKPRWGLGHVTLRLKRLLAIADQGICLMGTQPYQLGLSVKSQSCLFATRTSVPPVPLYLFRGTNLSDRNTDWLDIGGSNNFYKNTKVVLRVEPTAAGPAMAELTFDDLKSPDAASWFTERSPQPATVFSWPPPPHTVDRQQLDDFVQPGTGEGWFVWDFDIVPSELPPLPDSPNR